MKNKNNFILILLIFMFCFSVINADIIGYNDISKSKYKSDIEKVSSMGIFSPSGNKFQPKKAITREEMAFIISNIIEEQNIDQNSINNVIKTAPKICTIQCGNTIGSGVLIEENKILTAYHVVSNLNDIIITFYPDGIYKTKIVKFDSDLDLALLEITDNKLNIKPIIIAKKSEMGQSILVFGSPLNLTNSVTKGIISNNKRWFPNKNNPYIQVDAPISSGNSGGAVVDNNGNLVGIVICKILSEDGLSFAVDIDSINKFLK